MLNIWPHLKFFAPSAVCVDPATALYLTIGGERYNERFDA